MPLLRDNSSICSSHHPGIFAAAALRRVDDQRTPPQRDARQSTGQDVDARCAAQDVWAKIDVASLEMTIRSRRIGDERWRPGERDHRLGNVVARVRLNPPGELRDLALVRTR